jgi:hypothetical protein
MKGSLLLFGAVCGVFAAGMQGVPPPGGLGQGPGHELRTGCRPRLRRGAGEPLPARPPRASGGRVFRARPAQRDHRPDLPAWRAEWAGAAPGRARRRLWRHAPGRHDLQRGEILSQPAGGHRLGGPADHRPRPAGTGDDPRRRLRERPERRHHLAAPADQHLRMGGRALRQVRRDRPRPRPGEGGCRAEGRCAAAACAGDPLGVQRRAGETACRSACCACSAGRCRRSSPSASRARSAAAGTGSGMPTTMRWWRWMAAACPPSPAARIGARGMRIHAEDQARIGELVRTAAPGAGGR